MNSSSLLSSVTFIYGLAAMLYTGSWIFKKKLPGKIAFFTAVTGIAGNLAGMILRWVESYKLGIGHAPLSNMYESLVFFSFTIISLCLIFDHKNKRMFTSILGSSFAFLAMAYASLSPNVNDRIQPLIPALKSNWLIVHVITCFFGYAAFAAAFGISLIYLMKQNSKGNFKKTSLVPANDIMDELTHQMVMFGFLFLTIGIITGAVWANSAWGSYWSWDPKETWSLITWFIYATMLHARITRGWAGKRIAWLSIIGFAAVIFTYFGVNLLPGLHSYSQ